MQKRILNEVTEEERVQAIFQKSLSRAPLTIDEVNQLEKIDMGSLIIEYDMTYPQATHIVYWLKNETQRITNRISVSAYWRLGQSTWCKARVARPRYF